MASRKNPASGESMLILLGVAVAGYFAYINNMLAGLGLPYSATAVAAPTTGTAAGALATQTSGTTSSTAAAVAGAPSLGTPVSTAANAQLQAAAGYPYIIPTGALTSSSPPSGYQLFNTQDMGNIWATNQLVQAAQAYVATANAACTVWKNQPGPIGQTPCPSQPGPMTTALMKTIVSQAGLSGLGFVRGKSMFPFNPITGGMGILNAPPNWN